MRDAFEISTVVKIFTCHFSSFSTEKCFDDIQITLLSQQKILKRRWVDIKGKTGG